MYSNRKNFYNSGTDKPNLYTKKELFYTKRFKIFIKSSWISYPTTTYLLKASTW